MRPFETSFCYKPLVAPKVHANSPAMIKELVRKSVEYGATLNETKFSSRLQITKASDPIIYPKIISKHISTTTGLPYTYVKPLTDRFLKGLRIPLGAKPAGGTDGTLAIYDPIADVFCDFWRPVWDGFNLTVAWGGVIDNASQSQGIHLKKFGCRATGIAANLGVPTLAEAEQGVIKQMVAFAMPRPALGYVWPANRGDGDSASSVIKEGSRFFLLVNTPIQSAWPPLLKMLVQVGKTHGFCLVDKAAGMSIPLEEPVSGDPWLKYRTVGGVTWPRYKIAKTFWKLFDLWGRAIAW